jgi:hypothetical protein
MTIEQLYPIQTVLGFVLFGTIAVWWVAPALRARPRADALRPLLVFSAFRYLGLNFAVPDAVAQFPERFVAFAPYGDLACALLALAAAYGCKLRPSLGVGLAWLYAVAGAADFAVASYFANAAAAPVHAGTSWPIFLLGGPSFIVTLVLLFRFLVAEDASSPRVAGARERAFAQ